MSKKLVIITLIIGGVLSFAIAGTVYYLTLDKRPVLTVTKAEMEEALVLDNNDMNLAKQRLTHRKILEAEAPGLGIDIATVKAEAAKIEGAGFYDAILAETAVRKVSGETTWKNVVIKFSATGSAQLAQSLGKNLLAGVDISKIKLNKDMEISEIISTRSGILADGLMQISQNENSVFVPIKQSENPGLGQNLSDWTIKVQNKYQIKFP